MNVSVIIDLNSYAIIIDLFFDDVQPTVYKIGFLNISRDSFEYNLELIASNFFYYKWTLINDKSRYAKTAYITTFV